MRLIENFSIARTEDFLDQSRTWDIFLACSSFEERCVRGSEILSAGKAKLGISLIFNYKETDPQGNKEKNIIKMKQSLQSISCSHFLFNTESVSLPSDGIKKFLTFVEERKIKIAGKEVIVDITVFTKPYFFLLFKVLAERFGIRQFHIIYTEPEKYRSKQSNRHEIVLTEGLDRIESMPGFVGSSVNRKDALIVILGFEGKRAMEVFYNVNPELTCSINGFPSFRPGWHRISLEGNLRFLKESGASEHLFLAPAIDPFETRSVLARIVSYIRSENRDFNVIIAPLGSKMQAFGVFLYAYKIPSVKVIYPFPSSFSPHYSSKYGPSWIAKVSLDDLPGGKE